MLNMKKTDSEKKARDRLMWLCSQDPYRAKGGALTPEGQIVCGGTLFFVALCLVAFFLTH